MKSKCKCSLSFLDNKKLCHGFFSSYCIIIIINKKEGTTGDFSYADVSFYPYNRSIRPLSWPLLKDSFKMWVSRGPVPGARVAANPRLLSCKYHSHRNVGGKEDLEGPCRPCRSATRLLGRPFEGSTDDQVVLYCISLGHVSVEKNTKCTVHLLHLRTSQTQQ